MTTPHDAIAATAEQDADLLRNVLIRRMTYNLASLDDPQDFEAFDTETGAIPQALGWHETLWWLDPDDATTPHDGITTLVTADDYRYKANDLDLRIKAALDRDLTAPPGSPAIGDAYLVAAASTGDWAGHDDDVAIYTARGWAFRTPAVGDWLLIEDEDVYLRYTAAGAWSAGPGPRSFSANSIPVSAIINAARTSFIVENQTTNTPPASPAVGVAYIIGSVPTGAWAGKALQVAVCEATGTWAYYAPSNGFQAYDKALNAPYRYTGAAWVSSAGAITGVPVSHFTASGSTTSGGAGSYTYSDTVAPTTAFTYVEDSVTIDYAAAKSSARLRFNYAFATGNGNPVTAGLFRDAEVNALAWYNVSQSTGRLIVVPLEITTADATQHTYKIRLINNGGGAVAAPTRRLFSVEEFA